jgi:hypothetical protein
LLHAAIGARARLLRATVEPIAHRVVRETTAGLERMKVVYRASSDDLTERACDVVIKRLRGDAATDDPHRERFMPAAAETHPNYWRREYDAYDASSPIASLPAPLRAPRCYAREIGDANATLWLESIDREPATDWPDERFYDIARAFGAWRSAREPRWLARGSLRMWAPGVDSPAYAALADSEAWTSPRVAGAFGRDVVDDVRHAWDVRDHTIAELEARPQRLAHNDLWTSNLLGSRTAVVAIDWSELGISPVAHDLVNLVLDSIWMFDLTPDRLEAVEGAVLAGYRDGASDVSPETIERAYRANALVRFGLLAGALVRSAADAPKRDELAERYGRSFDAVFDARATVVRKALRPNASYLK